MGDNRKVTITPEVQAAIDARDLRQLIALIRSEYPDMAVANTRDRAKKLMADADASTE